MRLPTATGPCEQTRGAASGARRAPLQRESARVFSFARLDIVALALLAALAGCGRGERASSGGAGGAGGPGAPSNDAAEAASSVPATDAAALASDKARAFCTRLCDKHAPLACPNTAGCAAVCEAAVTGGCGSAWQRYFACVIDLPLEALVCNAAGRADLRPGQCAEPHELVRRCLSTATR